MMDDIQKAQYSSCHNENGRKENLYDWAESKLRASAVLSTLWGVKV